jgi:1-acyl-sn-glycerol-3-phosphate acyltransferase
MFRTILFFLVLWLSLFLSLLLFIPYLFLLFPFQRSVRNHYIAYCTRTWAKMILFVTGTRIKLKGQDNIPKDPDFVVISNHQGNMDIPVLMSIFPFPLSFIAKKELMVIPIINLWLLALNSININRRKPIKSYYKIEEKLTGRFNPLILFPEGSRSRGQKEGNVKKGGLSLIEKSGKKVVKVNIDGSYKIWELHKKITPADVNVIIE